MQKFDTPAPVAVVLDLPAGRIRFIVADRGDTTVEVLPADATNSRDAKAAERIAVAYEEGAEGGTLRIGAAPAKNRLLGGSGSVEVTVQLPAGSRVEAKAAAAELRGVGRLGDVAFEGAQGSVKLDEAASARIGVLAGDVSVGAARGVSAALDAGTTFGRIDNSLRNAGGTPGLTLHATTAYGDITARSL